VPNILDLDSESDNVLDLDATPQRGAIGRAWDFATKPITEHMTAAGVSPEFTSTVAKGLGTGFEMLIPGGRARAALDMWADRIPGAIRKPLQALPTPGSFVEQASPLDVATAPAGMAGRAGLGGRLVEMAQAAGIGTEGILQLKKAQETGDWSEVPGGVVRLVLAKMGMGGGISGLGGKISDEIPIPEGEISAFEKATRAKMRASDAPFAEGATTAGASELSPPPQLSSFEQRLRAQGPESVGTEPLTSPTAGTSSPGSTYEAKLRQHTAGASGTGELPNPGAGHQKRLSYEEKLRAANAAMPETGDNVLDLDAGAATPGPAIYDPALAGDDLMRAAQEAEQAVTTMSPEVAAKVGALPPTPEGMTRVYRGEGELSTEGSTWFTTEAAEAASYAAGGRLKYVDVPTARLEQLNESLGRSGPPAGEFDFSGGMEGYAARAQEVPGIAGSQAGLPVDPPTSLEKQLQDSLALTKGVESPLGTGAPRLAPRSGESGFITTDFIKDAYTKTNQAVGDFLRSSVAGDIPTAIRNVQSGLRMVGEAMFENPIAAGFENLAASRARASGNVTAALDHDRAAKLFMETSKAFAGATFEEGAATLADALSFISRGKVAPQWGNPSTFKERTNLMREVGDKKLADKLDDFSSAALTGDSGWRKGLMFFNIIGDRFINRTFLKAHVDAAQRVFGASSPQQLEALAARNPVVREKLQEFLVNAGSEAFRASWQNTAASGYTKTLIKALDNTPLGLVVQPFGKAFFANMLPNILEKVPGLAFGSKRVRNSFEFQSNKNAMKMLQGMPSTPATRAQIAHLRGQNSLLAQEGVYAPSKIYARMVTGPVLMTAAIAARLDRGDDGTEFDQTAVELGADGKATKVASWTSQMGEDLPFIYLGDRIAHEIIAKREGRPSKYEGKDGVASLKPLMKAIYGSRYGVANPALDMIAGGLSGKQEFDSGYVDRTARAIAEDLGRMAGAGSWLGGTARRIAAANDPEEAKLRRGDVTQSRGPLARVKEAFVEGAQTQIPGLRKQLPESQAWSKLAPGRTVDPLEPLTGQIKMDDVEKLANAGKPVSALLSILPGSSRFEVSKLDQFANAHQGKVSLSQILPRRTQEPAFDELMMKHLRDGLTKRALPALESGKIDKLSPEAQVVWFGNLAKIRDQAHDKATRDFRRLTGAWPQAEEEKRAAEKKKREAKRQTKRELRSVEY
jgi:hypothetical protein